MTTYREPWADAANKAIGAVYKSLATRPSQAEMENQALRNQLLGAQYHTELARRDKIGMEKQMLQGRQDASSDLANMFADIYAPMQIEGPRPTPETAGPMPMIESRPDQDTMQDRFYDRIPQFAEIAARYGVNNPGDFAKIYSGFIGNAGAPQDTFERSQMAAGSPYSDTISGFREKLSKGGDSGGVRGQKISDAMAVLGLNEAEATKLVDGYMKLSTDNMSGMRTLTDLTTGDMRVLEPSNVQQSPPILPMGPVSTHHTDLSFDPSNATGVVATAMNLYNNTLGQVPKLPTIQGPERDAQKMRVLERDIVKALSSSSRPPVIEQQSITSMLPQPFEWFENPQIADEKVASVVELLMEQYHADAVVANNVMTPKAEKADRQRRMNEIRRTLSSVVSPEYMQFLFPQLGGGGLTPEEQQELEYLESLERGR
jgi:hypothetical protein